MIRFLRAGALAAAGFLATGTLAAGVSPAVAAAHSVRPATRSNPIPVCDAQTLGSEFTDDGYIFQCQYGLNGEGNIAYQWVVISGY